VSVVGPRFELITSRKQAGIVDIKGQELIFRDHIYLAFSFKPKILQSVIKNSFHTSKNTQSLRIKIVLCCLRKKTMSIMRIIQTQPPVSAFCGKHAELMNVKVAGAVRVCACPLCFEASVKNEKEH
jgi:hypothetical protein